MVDIEKITESVGARIKDIIIGELKEEFKTFRSEDRVNEPETRKP